MLFLKFFLSRCDAPRKCRIFDCPPAVLKDIGSFFRFLYLRIFFVMDWNSAMMWAELPAVYFVPFAGPASLPKLCDNVLFLFLGKFGIFVSGGSGRPMPWVLLNFSVLNTKFFFGFVFRYIFLSVESSPWRMGFDLRLLCDREADYRSLWDCESRFGFPVFISWQKSSRKDSKFWFLTPLGLVDSLIWEL